MVFDCEVEVPDGTTAIPQYHTFQAPPQKDGHYAVMQGGWVLVEGDKPSDPDLDPTVIAARYDAEQKARRAAAYAVESDPIFFKVYRSEATMDEWENKVNEIRARYPYSNE